MAEALKEQGWFWPFLVFAAFTQDFYLCHDEVTQEEWQKITGGNLQELNKRGKQPGWVYRLPREAEWEYAGRSVNPRRGFNPGGDEAMHGRKESITALTCNRTAGEKFLQPLAFIPIFHIKTMLVADRPRTQKPPAL